MAVHNPGVPCAGISLALAGGRKNDQRGREYGDYGATVRGP